MRHLITFSIVFTHKNGMDRINFPSPIEKAQFQPPIKTNVKKKNPDPNPPKNLDLDPKLFYKCIIFNWQLTVEEQPMVYWMVNQNALRAYDLLEAFD